MKRLFALWLFFITTTVSSQNIGTVLIKLNKQVNQGNLLVYIYNKAENFPKRKDLCYKTLIIKANHTRQVVINDLPFNTYAIIVVHDKNNNKKLDRNWLGLPAEPYALSKKAPFRFGPPKFEDVKFAFYTHKKVLFMEF